MRELKIMGLESEAATEKLFAEEGYEVLWARRRGNWGYAVDIKGGRGGHFRARAIRHRVLTGEMDPKDTDRFQLEKDSLSSAKEQIEEFADFLA